MTIRPIAAGAPSIGAAEREAVDRVLRSGLLAQGPEVEAFEQEFGQLVGGAHCVAVNSGTSALQLGLLAAGIGPGHEVIVPSFTFAATANAVVLCGATPVFADIDPSTFCLDPVAVSAVVTPRTSAIMPVHLYGHPAPMTELVEVAKRYGLALFEDAAQAHAATLHGTPVGTFGTFGMFSFYPTKNMTSGEGGMVTTPDAALARKVRLLRNQGMERRYRNEVVGFNMRMTDIHAAIGRVQLSRLVQWTKQRQENAAFFDQHLQGVTLPQVASGAAHVYHQYTIRVPRPERDRFVAGLTRDQIGSGVYYPVPTHRLPSFDAILDLPETQRAAAEVVSLPVHPALSTADLERVVDAVNSLAGTFA